MAQQYSYSMLMIDFKLYTLYLRCVFFGLENVWHLRHFLLRCDEMRGVS